MEIRKVKIGTIKNNPNNPRIIKDDKFKKLVESVKSFPEMLEIRPIVVNKEMVILGGNMRYKACKEAGIKEVPIMVADNLTEDQEREFVIKDNVSGGEWDMEMLGEWNTEELEAWGLDIGDFGSESVEELEATDYSDKNKEIDTDEFAETMEIKLKYVEDEYHLVKDALSKIASTPEQAVFKLLGL